MHLRTVFEVFPRPGMGLESVVAALALRKPEIIGLETPDENTTIEQAEEELRKANRGLRSAGSDSEFWGWNGQKTFWTMVVDTLKAVKLTGPENLPDVPFPDLSSACVMDGQAAVQRWGEQVLLQARREHCPSRLVQCTVCKERFLGKQIKKCQACGAKLCPDHHGNSYSNRGHPYTGKCAATCGACGKTAVLF